MTYVAINKDYKVTIELDVTLLGVKEECETQTQAELEALVYKALEENSLINQAANHLGDDLKEDVHEEYAGTFDHLEFVVDDYTVESVYEV